MAMMYMFDHDEILSCAGCDLAHVTRQSPLEMECILDHIDIKCTDVGEGIPMGCPLTKVTKEKVEAHGIQ